MTNEPSRPSEPETGDAGEADEAARNEAATVGPPTPPSPDEPGKEAAAGGLKLPDWYDDSFDKAVRAAIPELGATWRRWYDPPYRFLSWWVRSWRADVVPRRLRDRIHGWKTTLIRYHDHERNKARSLDDPMHNVYVPDDEHVTVPALWVIELFPPSAAAELSSLVRKYNPSIRLFGDEEEAVSFLSHTRAGQGYDWFVLGFIQTPKSRRLVPDSRGERLPDPFWGVELTAIQLGTGLTAVVAQFHLTDDGAASLDREWHRQHEPRLRRQGKHLIADDREWSAYSQTQQACRRPHDAAREWMSQNCSGLFAQSGEPQPLMDLLIVEKHSPTSGQRLTMEERNAPRALGLTGTHRVIVSPVIRQFALTPTEPDMCPTLGTKHTWAMWGNRAETVAARPGLTKYAGSDEYRALAHTVDRETRDIFLALSVTEMVYLMQQHYTALRDTARRQHDSFSSEYLQGLRHTLLTLSIDLASTKVDVPSWWERHRRSIPPLYVVDPFDDEDQPDGDQPEEFTERLRSRQTNDLAKLSEADATIRDILSTVASLGAASDAYSIGRRALYVAALSLVVALVTLLFTSIGSESVAAHLWTWLQSLWSFVWHHLWTWL